MKFRVRKIRKWAMIVIIATLVFACFNYILLVLDHFRVSDGYPSVW
jgi:hypothetical protein